MKAAGLGIAQFARLLRDARLDAALARPLVVDGVLARELGKILGAGGDPTTVQVGGDSRRAAVYVVVLAGAAAPEQVEQLRRAARALVPVMAVQTSPADDSLVPNVPATEIVVCPPGQGFPLREIADTIARLLAHEAVPLAARLPALRPVVEARLAADASRRVVLLGLLAARSRPLFPLMTLEQLRLELDLALIRGRELDRERAPELGAVFGVGLGVRTLVRWLGLGESRLVAAATGYTVTRAIAEAERRWVNSLSK
jgi:hypothetical protein